MRVRLIYSPDVVEKPILAEVISKTGLLINILEAKVNAQKGELVVSIPSSGEKLEEAIAMFRRAGVKVEEIKETLKIDQEKCISCGACISPCPTQALQFSSEWTLKYEEEKCVACGTCVNACPFGALTLLEGSEG